MSLGKSEKSLGKTEKALGKFEKSAATAVIRTANTEPSLSDVESSHSAAKAIESNVDSLVTNYVFEH